ncbi:translation initiation factor IF-2-like [Pipra filicauda]|uniref:Translation initiation factor IF-2-like n=1 Tax=Pipra filicauda TaxID=649802 RepID=A0A7R5L448_9PASS|nr:translation initiation factor IF-2-like [Pipra filicauda]XP_039244762.1 translation initiation factor IF-2-like [Pipra filicauda]XP_039244763.1 translation initiation factor IF-2-like [Pipra filicauda]
MVAIHIAADVPQNHVEDQQDGEDEQSHQDSLGHRRDEGLHVTRGPPPRTDDSGTARGQRARTDPAAPPPPPPPPPPPATRRATAAGADPVAERRGLPPSAPPLRRSGGRGGSPAGGTGRCARTGRRGGAPGHGHRGPAAASSPPCGGGGGGPGAGKLKRGGGPWGTGVKRPVALRVSNESHPRGRESCGRDAAGAAAPGPEGSVRGDGEPPAARAARPRQTGTAPAGVFRPAEVFPPLPPLAPSSSSATASCGPPASRRRAVGEPRPPVRAVVVTAEGCEETGFPFPVHPLRQQLACSASSLPSGDRPGAGAGGGEDGLSPSSKRKGHPSPPPIKLKDFFFFQAGRHGSQPDRFSPVAPWSLVYAPKAPQDK